MKDPQQETRQSSGKPPRTAKAVANVEQPSSSGVSSHVQDREAGRRSTTPRDGRGVALSSRNATEVVDVDAEKTQRSRGTGTFVGHGSSRVPSGRKTQQSGGSRDQASPTTGPRSPDGAHGGGAMAREGSTRSNSRATAENTMLESEARPTGTGGEGGECKGGGASALSQARGVVSDDLQRVLDEEVVTYSWRRKGAVTKADKRERDQAHPDQAKAGDEVKLSPTHQEDDDVKDGRRACSVAGSGNSAQKQRRSSVRFSVENSSPRQDVEPSQDQGHQPPAEGGSGNGSDCGKAQASTSGGRSIGSGNRTTAGRPPRPVGKQLASYDPKAARAQSSQNGASQDASSKLSLSSATLEREKRMAACKESPSLAGTMALTAYDGTAPRIRASPVSQACRTAISLWAQGAMSGAMACLYLDDWVQGDLAWADVVGGACQQQLCVAAGMLADASLRGGQMRMVLETVFSSSPNDVCRAVTGEILAFAISGESVVLVAEAETVLSRREVKAMNDCPSSRLRAFVERELVRHFFTDTDAEQEFTCTDEWLQHQLKQTPDEMVEAVRVTESAHLQAENQALDTYLVRLLRWKRAIVSLLDSLEKVDHYAILGLAPTASDKDLKSAYRKMCLRLHPDKGGDKAQFQQLQDAYARILEEREQATAAGGAPRGVVSPRQEKQRNGSEGHASRQQREKPAHATDLLQLEDASAGASPTISEDPDLVSAHDELQCRVEALGRHAAEAERLETRIQQLRQAQGDGVEALRTAQQAGEQLMTLSQDIGGLGPGVGEAAMEVAENSLALAARFSQVPSALLLTDVALSCTFEASRAQHSAARLLEVKQDTGSTLQTLRTNLQMAKLIGQVDAETFKLSIALVSKASRRILASLREVATAAADAWERARQCRSQAKAVMAFAARRAAAAPDEDGNEFASHGQFALPAPEGTGVPAPQQQQHQQEQGARYAGSPVLSTSALLESRRQNDRLLRQLNSELGDLQRRAKTHLARQNGTSAAAASTDALGQALALAGEALAMAADAAVSELQSTVDVGTGALRQMLARNFSFVEACDVGLAMSTNPQTQLLRLAALIDAQAVIDALRQGMQSRLVAACSPLQDDLRHSFVRVIETYFEKLCTSIVGCRM